MSYKLYYFTFRYCLPEFNVGGKVITNCTKLDLSARDVTKPCALMMKELKFIKELDTSKGVMPRNSRYRLMDLNELANGNTSPVEISIKVDQQY